MQKKWEFFFWTVRKMAAVRLVQEGHHHSHRVKRGPNWHETTYREAEELSVEWTNWNPLSAQKSLHSSGSVCCIVYMKKEDKLFWKVRTSSPIELLTRNLLSICNTLSHSMKIKFASLPSHTFLCKIISFRLLYKVTLSKEQYIAVSQF